MDMTSFLWQEKFDTNYAVGHYKKRKTLKRIKRNVEYAAGSMDTTPEDYTKFIQAMLVQKGLSKNLYKEFFKSQIRIESKQQFGKNRLIKTTENNDIELSYALGFETYKTPFGKAILKKVIFKVGNITQYFIHHIVSFNAKYWKLRNFYSYILMPIMFLATALMTAKALTTAIALAATALTVTALMVKFVLKNDTLS